MKIIQAMKTLKHLQEKNADLRAKVALYCANLDYETPTYPDQAAQIKQWIQSHTDTNQEIARLRVALQRTNLATSVPIEIDGQQVTKTIAEWIHRRKDLAKLDYQMWAALGNRDLKEGFTKNSAGEQLPVRIRRYFDPVERDKMIAIYHREPSLIDATLEVINAVTDLVELN